MHKLRHRTACISAAASAAPSDRRSTPRFAPVDGHAWFAWDRGDKTSAVAALLLDISQDGAALVVDDVPAEGLVAWVRPRSDPKPEWVEAVVRGVERTPRGPHLVRVAFRTPCPWEALRSALYGLTQYLGGDAPPTPPRRFDRPQPLLPSAEARRPPMTLPVREEGSNRRSAPRHVALEHRCWLGWWDGAEFCSGDASLIEISRGGASLEAGAVPPRDRSIWLCLHAAGTTWGAEVRLAGARPRGHGTHRLGVAFVGACPEGLYKAAVCGHRGVAREPAARPRRNLLHRLLRRKPRHPRASAPAVDPSCSLARRALMGLPAPPPAPRAPGSGTDDRQEELREG
jgi:hypothetical protein